LCLEDFFFPDEVVWVLLVGFLAEDEELWALPELAVEEVFLPESVESCRGVVAAGTLVSDIAQRAANATVRIGMKLFILNGSLFSKRKAQR